MRMTLFLLAAFLLYSCQEDKTKQEEKLPKPSMDANYKVGDYLFVSKIDSADLELHAQFMENPTPSTPEDKTKYILSIRNKNPSPIVIPSLLNSGNMTNGLDSIRITIYTKNRTYTESDVKLITLEHNETVQLTYEDCLTPLDASKMHVTFDVSSLIGTQFETWIGQVSCFAERATVK
jgi:hypothetical protein